MRKHGKIRQNKLFHINHMLSFYHVHVHVHLLPTTVEKLAVRSGFHLTQLVLTTVNSTVVRDIGEKRSRFFVILRIFGALQFIYRAYAGKTRRIVDKHEQVETMKYRNFRFNLNFHAGHVRRCPA